MSRKAFMETLETTASEQVPMGVYAIEKDGQVDLRCDRCSSITQLKRMIREYKKAGYKVYANGR